MIKKAAIFTVVAAVMVSFLAVAAPVRAQAGPTVLSSSAAAAFPASLTFSLSARADVPITDIRLQYVVNQESFADVTSEELMAFTPAASVEVSWSLQMLQIGGLPPGVGVDYWWLITDSSGGTTRTPRASVAFGDDRYPWRSLPGDNLTIFWYSGSDSFASELMAAAQAGLAQLHTDTGARLDRPVDIYIYASTADLQGAMVYPTEWTGGAAYTRFSTIVIGISPLELSWGKGAIVHELTHMVTYQMTRNPYGGLPTWLDEGLATYAQGLPDPSFTTALYQAVIGGKLISVRSLSSRFSALADQATLSYAESDSIVSYLIASYGQPKMLELLSTFQQGSTYDGALLSVFGFDTEGLDTLWQAYVTAQYRPAGTSPPMQAGGVPPPFILALAIPVAAVTAGIGALAARRRRSAGRAGR